MDGQYRFERNLGPDWLVPMRRENRTVGLMVIGELPIGIRGDPALLHPVGHLLELYWRHVDQAWVLAVARSTDPASGVLNRIDLTAQADVVLHHAATEGEPAVVLALSVEGVRRLNDSAQWEEVNWLMHEVGAEMRRKLRSDDLVGRFSDDCFVAILRRLDISLAQLIARKLLDAVHNKISQNPMMKPMIEFRCGLGESRGEGLENLLIDVFEALRCARHHRQNIVLATNARPANNEVVQEVKA
jgi:diguanylate cyclase (GGDEF)-like protein